MRGEVRLRWKAVVVEGKYAGGEQDAAGADVGSGVGGAKVIVVVVDECEIAIAIAAVNATGQVAAAAAAAVRALKGCSIQRWKWP